MGGKRYPKHFLNLLVAQNMDGTLAQILTRRQLLLSNLRKKYLMLKIEAQE
jgi:hypothetical protein